MSSRWISATQSMKLWSRIADIFRRDNCVHIFTSYWIMNSKYGLDECNRVILMMLCRYRGNHNKTPNEPKLNSKHYKKERQVSRDFIHFQFIWQRTISFINRVWGFLVKNGRNLESKFVDTFPFDYQNVLAFLIIFEEIIKMYIAVICDLWSCIHCMFTCSF